MLTPTNFNPWNKEDEKGQGKPCPFSFEAMAHKIFRKFGPYHAVYEPDTDRTSIRTTYCTLRIEGDEQHAAFKELINWLEYNKTAGEPWDGSPIPEAGS